MNKITSIEDINALITAGVEECTTLEYKSDINTSNDKWKGEMAKSINKYLVCFRAMVGYAHKARLHNNSVAEKSFSKIRVRECDKAKEIYLNDAELQALYEMPLEGLDAQVRDVFLVGCYTCQRYSDYSALTANNFTTTARGNKVVRLIQKKTSTLVAVPIMNDNLLRIAERYDFNIPEILMSFSIDI